MDRAAIGQIKDVANRSTAGDPSLLPLIHELDATKLLWDLKDWEALEQRFQCASRLNPPESIASRRADVLRAIVLINLHRNRDGAEELTKAWSDAQALNDFTPADTAELQWLTAIVFVPAGRFDQARALCRAVAERGGQRSPCAATLDAFCLDHLGRKAEAQIVAKIPSRRTIRSTHDRALRFHSDMRYDMKWISFCILALSISCPSQVALADSPLVMRIRSDLQVKPRDTVDQLNRGLMDDLLKQKEYAAVKEFAITGTIAVADDPGGSSNSKSIAFARFWSRAAKTRRFVRPKRCSTYARCILSWRPSRC